MTPRKASLRVAHSSKCALRKVVVGYRGDGTPKYAEPTALDSTGKGSGCTCKPGPSWYVSFQTSDGKTRKTERVKVRREAEKALNEKQVELDRGVTGYREQKDTTLPEWADEYAAILEQRNVKGETRRGYADTLAAAVDAIGHVRLRELGNGDLRKFLAHYDGTADATKIRRLKELSASLNAAKDEGYLEVNPVPAFKRGLRLRAPKTGTPPFSDGEIVRLLAAIERPKVGKGEPVYLAIAKAAVLTGARIGELIALRWDALNLTAGELLIRSTYNPADGVIEPKDNDHRTVYLTEDAIEFFGEWIKHEGIRDGLMFRAPRSDSYVNDDYVRKVIHAAIKHAGIAAIDPDTGIKRKPFHSFRATYARQMLEQGKHPSWVESNLGHSDLKLTMHVYGTWTKDALRAEAKREGQAA